METGKELAIGLSAPLPDVERYSSRYYISFKSRESTYKDLFDALKDDNNYIIGLQGMGGTGKTTLAKEVGKKLKQSEQFTCIIDTTVSFSPDIKKIQDDIAGSLGLKFDDCSESDRPKKLWKRLTNGEKILLILDDVWGDIDFEEIGIPCSDNHKGCRVLVTTRNVLVCNRLGCNKTIRLELLSEEDAWEMFKHHAGLIKISTESLHDKGRKIANECKGLPIAIAVIARSLKGKQHREEWDVALKSLQKYASMHEIDDDDIDLVKIYQCLKFSYDNMNDGKAKGLFLLCSLFQEDEEIPTESLVRLGIGAGLFGENYGNYEDARSQVVTSKNKLLDSCLLLEVDQNKVKMHDLVRDAAQRISNKEIQTIKLYNKSTKTMVEREKNIKYLSCEAKVNDVLSCKLDSSKLQILIVTLVYDDYMYEVIPNSFFENISGLRIFHLFTDFLGANLSLPQSIKSLKNIRSLLFTCVDLGDISILENLQSLETLDLDYCAINEFPEGMAELQNLRLLNLRTCHIKRNNPFKVFEGCSSLEELYFIDSFNNYCQEISFPMLQRFIISERWMCVNDSLSKCVSLFRPRDKHFLSEKKLKECIQVVEDLRLKGIWWEWVNIIPEIVPMDHGMNDLVELRLCRISQLKCLIDTKHGNSKVKPVFSKLVVLELEEMESLEELCNGPLSFDSLKSLEKLSITRCNQLQSLSKCNLNLYNLKSLSLAECPRLISLFQLTTSRCLVSISDERKEKDSRGEIVEDDDNNDSKRSHSSMFPKLKDFHITHCHGLEFILQFLSIQDLPALESFSISQCWKLQYIFGQYVQLGSLIKMSLTGLPDFINIFPKCHLTTSSPISRDASKPEKQPNPLKQSIFSWTDKSCFGKKYWHKSMTTSSTKIQLISEDQQQDCLIASESNSCSVNVWGRVQCLLTQSLFMWNIKEIELFEISKIESLFILSIAPRILLETLTISYCDELKHIIIDAGDLNSGGNNWNNVFPKLKMVKVRCCMKLEYLFECYSDAHQNYNEIHLHLPALECLYLDILPSFVAMYPKHYRTTFPLLKDLYVHGCYDISIKSIGDLQFLGSTTPEKTEAANSSTISETNKEPLVAPKQKVLMNEQSTDQQYSLGETDTTIKPQLDGSTTPEKTEAANSSTISETNKEPLVSPNQKVLMNGQLTDQQYSLGESDTTIKRQLDGSTTLEKTEAANSSTISETKKEPLVASKQNVLMNEQSTDQQYSLGETDTTIKPRGIDKRVEEGIASTNFKTLTSSTNSKSDSSSLPYLELINSSSDPLTTYECKISSQEDDDDQIVVTSLSMVTTETNDQVSLNDDAFIKVRSDVEEHVPKDGEEVVSKSKPSSIASQFLAIPSKEEPSQIDEDLSSTSVVTRELMQLASKKHLNHENLCLLNDFLTKHPSLHLRDTSLSNRYKGYAYNVLAELLKFLQTHNMLDVLGSSHSELVELLKDVRSFAFDKDWLDGVERRIIQQEAVLNAPIGY